MAGALFITAWDILTEERGLSAPVPDASASMPIFIQNSACALIDRHITVLARRICSCSSSSIFTMPTAASSNHE